MSTIGTVEVIASINTAQYKKGAKDIENINKNVEDSTDKTTSSGNKSWASMGVAIGAIAGITQAVFSKVASIVSNSIGDAIKRVDTLNNANRTFANMGFSAESTSKAMDALKQSILGLPTPLDQAVSGLQLISASTNDIEKSQQIFTALNNAILGFGGTANDVQGAIIQLSQAFSNGRIDAQTWNSLIQSGLGPALNALARELGITTGALKEGLSDGTISVEQFQDALIKMNKEGGGGLKSFEQISKDATSGIGTGWANLQTAITRGIASIIESVGSENISGAVTVLGTAFEGLFKSIAGVITFIQDNSKVFQTLAILIGAILTPAILAYTAAMIAAGISSLIAGAQMAAAWLLALGPIGLIIIAVTAITALIIANFDTVKKFVASAWEFIKNAAMSVFNWIKSNWPLLLAIITGPIGLATLAIVKNFDKIKNAVLAVKNWITGAFSTIAQIGTSIIKGAVNSVLGFAENTINGFINLINNALDAINKIPGVSIGKIGNLSVPKLAEGGIVQPTRGGVLANIAEAGEAEAVIPLSKLDQMLSGEGSGGDTIINIDMSGIMTSSRSDERAIAKRLIETVNQELRAKGQPEIGNGLLRGA